jgi:hypothetical protein
MLDTNAQLIQIDDTIFALARFSIWLLSSIQLQCHHPSQLHETLTLFRNAGFPMTNEESRTRSTPKIQQEFDSLKALLELRFQNAMNPPKGVGRSQSTQFQ